MRKEKTVTIEAEGRDKGKVFHLTEFSARRSDAWSRRALLALARSNVEMPAGLEDAGVAGIAYVGLKALSGASDADIAPILDELLECVEFVPDPGKPHVRRKWIDDDIEEIRTLITLRYEAFQLITGFTIPDALLIALQNFIRGVGNSFNTLTSLPKSGPLSEPA